MRTVVFDLDGTLVDSAPDIAWGINRMLAEHGLPPRDTRTIERLTGEGASVLVSRVYEQLGVSVDERRIGADTACYLDHYRSRPVADSKLYADAAETLPKLRGAGLRLGVCTNKVQNLAEAVLDHLGIGRWFEVVVGSDTTAHRKPHPEPLLHALRALDTPPDAAVFIGDTVIDRDCALAAGVACRIVDWGIGPLVAVPASSRLRRFADLLPSAHVPG